jgi:TPR repeat protein
MPLDALRQAAEGGTAAAQWALSHSYTFGLFGVDKDAVAERAWLRKAAAGGFLNAHYNLGTATMHDAAAPGADKAALLREAADWLLPLAEAGDAASQHNMYVCCGQLAQLSSGGEAAVRWLRAAAAQGHPYPVGALGNAAWHGHPGMGVARDRDEARRLFAAADAAGLPEEMRALRPVGAPGSTMAA